MAERTAWRICADNGWWSAFGKKRGRNGKTPGPPVHDDLGAVTDEKGRTRHEFIANKPNELWIGDITEHWAGEGKLYLCALKGVASPPTVWRTLDEVTPGRLKKIRAARARIRRHL